MPLARASDRIWISLSLSRQNSRAGHLIWCTHPAGDKSFNFDYVTVGHVTVDVIAADGSRRPGGGAFYSALQAARLGLRALILTQGSPPEIEALLAPYRDELELRILPAPATTTFATSWSGGQRSQRVLAWAGPIAGPIEVDTQILHFAPVARETPARVDARAPRRLRRAHAPGARAHVGPPRRSGCAAKARRGGEWRRDPLRTAAERP